jgi:hypothetical protein
MTTLTTSATYRCNDEGGNAMTSEEIGYQIGKWVTSAIAVGLILGGAMWFGRPAQERTAKMFAGMFFSAIVAMLILLLVIRGIAYTFGVQMP